MKKTLIIILIIISIFALISCNLIYDQEVGVTVANNCLPSVLEITSTFQASTSYATGFVIDERGYVITNAHVVTDKAGPFVYEAINIIGKFYNSNVEYELIIIDYDIDRDMALLKFVRNDLILKAVEIGNSNDLEYGQTVFTIGNAEGYGLSMTKGIISVPRRRFKDTDSDVINEVIQTDAPINSGSSGGPLIDTDSKVIGLISFKIKNNGTEVEGIGFAIPEDVFMDYFATLTNATPNTQQPDASPNNNENDGENI